MGTILIVESGTEIESVVGAALRGKGHAVRVEREAPLPSQGMPADLLVVEAPADAARAENLVRELSGRQGSSVIVALPRGTTDPSAARARLLNAGAADCLSLPLHPEETVALVQARLASLTYQGRLLSYSAVDMETGAYSHWLFDKRLAEEHTKAARYPMPLSLLLVALDDHESLRGRYGPPFLMTVLREIALVIQSSLRTSDFVARYGPHEFVVLLPFTSATDALVCAERIRGRTEVFPFRDEKSSANATVSVAVAGFSPKRTADPQSLTREAQVCLEFAQREGGNRVVADEGYMPISARAAVSHDLLIEDLRKGDELQQMKAYHALRTAGVKAVPALLSAVEDPNPDVRRYCAWALGIVRATDVIPKLIGRLKDAEEDVRAVAAWALGRIGDTAAVPPLVEAIADEDTQVRAAVALSLSTLTKGEIKPVVTGKPEDLRAESEKWRQYAARRRG
jgi:diguanylate cyclase (GGDEF)-like protein